MKVMVLGAGLVGGPMAVDLAKESGFEVTSADSSEEALAKLKSKASIKTVQADLSEAAKVK